MGVDLAFYCGKYQFYETPRYYPDHDVIREIQNNLRQQLEEAIQNLEYSKDSLREKVGEFKHQADYLEEE